jgi:hypothetical protein
VLVAVELVIESGVLSAEHVENVPARLRDFKRTVLQLLVQNLQVVEVTARQEIVSSGCKLIHLSD